MEVCSEYRMVDNVQLVDYRVYELMLIQSISRCHKRIAAGCNIARLEQLRRQQGALATIYSYLAGPTHLRNYTRLAIGAQSVHGGTNLAASARASPSESPSLPHTLTTSEPKPRIATKSDA